jgi:hypothetical protein
VLKNFSACKFGLSGCVLSSVGGSDLCFWGCLARVLMVLSMLVRVTFNVGVRGDWACWN